MSAMLEVKNIQVAYGKIIAVKDVSVTVNQGEIVTLIGSSGAGKSTTLRTISGLIKPKSGEITFNGKRIDGCLLYTSPSPRDRTRSRMPSSA